jgi:hypothetical protein
MKDVELNPLNQNQRKLLQWGVVLLIALFLLGYFFLLSKNSKKPDTLSSTIVLNDTKLKVFEDSYKFNQYPDKVVIHDSYFLIILPEQSRTIVYNINEKKLETTVNEVLLDYQKGQLLYNKKETFLNNLNLGTLCEYGLIRSDIEVLCVTKINSNKPENKLVVINLKTKKIKDIYVSTRIITALSVINQKVYLGEIDAVTGKSFIAINGQSMAVPTPVNAIYPINEDIYFASFKSAFNSQQESFYKVNNNVVRQATGHIIFNK